MQEFDNDLGKKFKFDFSSPESFQVDLKKLKKFIDKDKEAVIIFYGGEPLLEIEKIKKIMDTFSGTNVPFRMQTNGKLLNKLPSKYMNKITRILVSLDGTKERTDYNRGKETYDKVINNLKQIQKNGYKGEIVARMCISPPNSDLYEQVTSLIKTGFTSVHWQIDAGFYKFDYNKEKFEKFVEEFNKSTKRLLDFWVNEMKSGTVLKLYPFLGVTHSILNNEKIKLRCGAGYSGYAITTDGKVVACPIMNSIEDFKAGTIETDPRDLKKFDVSGRCNECNYRDLCGGRCLYWNRANLWPKEGDDMICETIKFLIDNIKEKIPEIQNMIKNEKISKKQFNYEKYFGPEIIP